MKPPNRVLLEAAARLFADGHNVLASDVRQLARHWTPADEQELCGRGLDEQEQGDATDDR